MKKLTILYILMIMTSSCASKLFISKKKQDKFTTMYLNVEAYPYKNHNEKVVVENGKSDGENLGYVNDFAESMKFESALTSIDSALTVYSVSKRATLNASYDFFKNDFTKKKLTYEIKHKDFVPVKVKYKKSIRPVPLVLDLICLSQPAFSCFLITDFLNGNIWKIKSSDRLKSIQLIPEKNQFKTTLIELVKNEDHQSIIGLFERFDNKGLHGDKFNQLLDDINTQREILKMSAKVKVSEGIEGIENEIKRLDALVTKNGLNDSLILQSFDNYVISNRLFSFTTKEELNNILNEVSSKYSLFLENYFYYNYYLNNPNNPLNSEYRKITELKHRSLILYSLVKKYITLSNEEYAKLVLGQTDRCTLSNKYSERTKVLYQLLNVSYLSKFEKDFILSQWNNNYKSIDNSYQVHRIEYQGGKIIKIYCPKSPLKNDKIIVEYKENINTTGSIYNPRWETKIHSEIYTFLEFDDNSSAINRTQQQNEYSENSMKELNEKRQKGELSFYEVERMAGNLDLGTVDISKIPNKIGRLKLETGGSDFFNIFGGNKYSPRLKLKKYSGDKVDFRLSYGTFNIKSYDINNLTNENLNLISNKYNLGFDKCD